MAHGFEVSRMMKAINSAVARHQSVSAHTRPSVGQSFRAMNRVEGLANLPPGAPLIVQDAEGKFTYLPGMDGPILPKE